MLRQLILGWSSAIILPVRKYLSSGGLVMANLATTRMSSKGQVVIPEDIRKRLKLKSGSRFVVVGKDDVIILKTIAPPSMSEFDELVSEARRQAKITGLKRSDITDAIVCARQKK